MISLTKTAPVESKKRRLLWKPRVTKFDLLKLCVLYCALSPIAGMGLYNHLLFFPFKDTYDLRDAFAEIESATNSKKIDLTIPSGSDQKLDAWYFKKADSKKLFLVSHGNGGSIAHRILLIPTLLKCNGSVLLYDYEGYGKSTGEATIPAIKQDGLAAYDYARNKLHYAPQDIIVYGESLGSGVSTYIANNRTVGGIILQSGFASLSMAAKDRLPWFNLYPPIAFSGIELDNAGYLHGSHAPLLLVHGDNDMVVPIKHADKNFAEASQPKQLVKFVGAGHNDIYTLQPKLFATTIANFVSGLP
jgi:uncharacterized protein